MKKYWNYLINSSIFLIYFLFLLFTLLFNQQFGWFLVILFTLYITFSWLSLSRRLSKIELVLTVPTLVYRDNSITVNVRIAKSQVPTLFLPRLTLHFPEEFIPEAQTFLMISKKEQQQSVIWTPQQRGIFETIPVQFIAYDYLGLFRKSKTKQIIFTPLVLPNNTLPEAQKLARFLTRKQQKNNFLPSQNLAGIREHRQGDSLKQIDWKRSAYYQQWLSREYEPAVQQTDLICFFWGTATNFEKMLDLYFSFLASYDQKTYPNQLIFAKQKYQGTQLSPAFFAQLRALDDYLQQPDLSVRDFKEILLFVPELSLAVHEQLSTWRKQAINVIVIYFENNQLFIQDESQRKFPLKKLS